MLNDIFGAPIQEKLTRVAVFLRYGKVYILGPFQGVLESSTDREPHVERCYLMITTGADSLFLSKWSSEDSNEKDINKTQIENSSMC